MRLGAEISTMYHSRFRSPHGKTAETLSQIKTGEKSFAQKVKSGLTYENLVVVT